MRLFLLVALLALSGAEKVLMIVTSASSWVPTTGDSAGLTHATGYWMVEFTHSYHVFLQAGFNVTVASPQGGNAKVDPQGFQFYQYDPDTQLYVVNDPTNIFNGRVPATENTVKLSQISNSDLAAYDALFLVGGTGAMFDYPYDADLQRIVRVMWESNKLVAAVCHGPIGLTNVQLTDGTYLIDGKTLTGFSNKEEIVLGNANECVFCALPACDPATCQGPDMPLEYTVRRNASNAPDVNGVASYLIEDKIIARGGKYTYTQQDWVTFYFRPHVVTDGRLITGQNPGAGRETAQTLVKALQRCSAYAATAFEHMFCTKIQQLATDPAPVCVTEGDLVQQAEAVMTCPGNTIPCQGGAVRALPVMTVLSTLVMMLFSVRW